MKKIILTIIISFLSFKAYGQSTNVLKFSCVYDPMAIKKEQKGVGFLESEKIDHTTICKIFNCVDEIEINRIFNNSDGKDEIRMRNSWFNHQGILLDDFTTKEKMLTITTYVSQSYFLETYLINRTNGNTTRKFYRFDNREFLTKLKKLERDNSKNTSLYNKKGRLSLNTLKSFSLEPWEVLHFEGSCKEGVGI